MTVHEIIPKSLNPKHWMDENNRIPLCTECHEHIHNTGAVDNAHKLYELRDRRLQEYYMARPLSPHSPHANQFPETYRETVFTVWYSKGKPRPKVLLDMIEPDPMLGTKPSSTVLSTWMKKFREKASSLDITVSEEMNTKLVADKIAMLERHASVAREMQEAGLDYLKTHDLGGARNAITMVVEGLRIERESVGAPRIAQRVLDMSDDELVQELRVLVKETTVTRSLPEPEEVIDV